MAGKPGRGGKGTPRSRRPGRVPRGARAIPPGKGTQGGAPTAEINLEIVANAAGIGCTVDEIAALLGIGRNTFYDHRARNPAVDEAIERGRSTGQATLRRNQWNAAAKGNPAMLIWLGKQMLGQKDRTEHSVDEGLEALLDRISGQPSPEPPPG